jgi:hypothetical protein
MSKREKVFYGLSIFIILALIATLGVMLAILNQHANALNWHQQAIIELQDAQANTSSTPVSRPRPPTDWKQWELEQRINVLERRRCATYWDGDIMRWATPPNC